MGGEVRQLVIFEPPTVSRLPTRSLERKGPALGTQGSTFFRKKFLPDFLSPLLDRTPRWRMYRLMALTTAALWGGVGDDPGTDSTLLPHSFPLPIHFPPQPHTTSCSVAEERGEGSKGQGEGSCSTPRTPAAPTPTSPPSGPGD